METNTQKENNKEFKSKLFAEYVHLLKQRGFKVYTFKKEHGKIESVFLVLNNQIGYVSEDYFGGLNFATVHKPSSRGNGSGFRINERPIIKPTIEMAFNTFINAPYWADGSKVTKWDSWTAYTKNPINAILTYYEV